MKHFNAEKSYDRQVKPFGFMVAPIALSAAMDKCALPELIDPTKRGRPCKAARPKPIAPFERDGALAAAVTFDRVTGDPVRIDQLKTYAEALALFHLSPEDKFASGEPLECGSTRRRHVHSSGITLIGKEANKVGEVGERDPIAGAATTFNPMMEAA